VRIVYNNMLLTIVIVFLTFLFLRLSYKRHQLNKRLKGFASPPGYPLFGHLFMLTSKLGRIPNLIEASRKYGGYLKLELFFGVPFLVITDKEFISRVINGYPLLVKDAMYDLTDKWLGDSIVVSKPEKWKKIRKIVTPAFSVQSLENYVKLLDAPCKTLIDGLKKELSGEAFDILPYMIPCTLEIITASIMGIKLDAQNNKDLDYISDSEEISSITLRRIFNPFKQFFITYVWTRDFWNERVTAARIRKFTMEVINRRRRMRSKNIDKDIRGCLLDTLLDAEYDGKPLTDKQIMDEVQTFVAMIQPPPALVSVFIAYHNMVMHRITF
ncbi:cytochrome P450, partial [Oryctes borbonicus]